jgi:DNA polymerase-3 subunit epsilon
MYAVIDLETTGLRTSWHDRVVEVAVVHVDEYGRRQGEWCSLVNPKRDMGPQHIHGISAAEARRAPTFDQLAGHLAQLLDGRALVAHNLPFDATFLFAEFSRLGITAPVDATNGLCTMRLASHFLPAAGRNLHDCRRSAGLPKHQAHSALHDARAAADLVGYYLHVAGSPPPWTDAINEARSWPWPPLPASTAVPVQRTAPGQRQEHFLSRLIDRLPRLHQPKADAYLDLLDRALLDRLISASEADGLVETAEQLGLARADVADLHEQYLVSLAAVALSDGVLTRDEKRDLDTVAALLGLASTSVQQALDQAKSTGAAPGGLPQSPAWRLQPDDSVVFTGTMNPPREHWQAEAEAAGLKVGSNVTKRTRLLVAADPDSASGKAEKARQYGIPIVHPAAYKKMLELLPG